MSFSKTAFTFILNSYRLIAFPEKQRKEEADKQKKTDESLKNKGKN